MRLLEGRMDPALDNYVTSAFSNVKGHRSYWEQRRQELFTMILYVYAYIYFLFRMFGPPTWFLTLNPAEYYWPEVVELYKSVYPDLEAAGVQAKVAEDPMPFCKFSERRFSAFLRKVLLAKNGPLGDVVHYWVVCS